MTHLTFGIEYKSDLNPQWFRHGVEEWPIFNSAVGWTQWLSWEPNAATAAIAGGLVSAIGAAGVFSIGILVERAKGKHEHFLKQSENAISSVFALRSWMDVGAKACNHAVVGVIAQKNSGDQFIFPRVFAIQDGNPLPEKLKFSDFSFLVSKGEIELLQDLMEIEAWAMSVHSAMQKYSSMRLDWEIWMLRNSTSAVASDGSIISHIPPHLQPESTHMATRMDSLLKGVSEFSTSAVKHQVSINKYIEVCQKHFKKNFPKSVELAVPIDQTASV